MPDDNNDDDDAPLDVFGRLRLHSYRQYCVPLEELRTKPAATRPTTLLTVQLPSPECAICKHPVDKFTRSYDDLTDEYVYEARCHDRVDWTRLEVHYSVVDAVVINRVFTKVGLQPEITDQELREMLGVVRNGRPVGRP